MITVRFNNEFGRNIAAIGFKGCSLATLPARICQYANLNRDSARVEIIIGREGTRAVTPAYMEYVDRHLTSHGLRLSRIVERTLKSNGRAQIDFRAVAAL